MTYPITPNLTIYFNTGATFDYGNFVLDDTKYGKLDFGTLAATETGDIVVDVSSQTVKATINTGYNLLLNQFTAGTATFRVIDQNGDFNPANTSSP